MGFKYAFKKLKLAKIIWLNKKIPKNQ